MTSPLTILHCDSLPDGEVGYFCDSEGYVHEFAYVADEGNLYHCRVDAELQSLAEDFVRGWWSTTVEAPLPDTLPLGFASGYLSTRNDALKCTGGNTPCGKRCIPKGQVCRSKGGFAKKAAKLGKIGAAAGLVGAGALLTQTEAGREALSETNEAWRANKKGKALKTLGKGVVKAGKEATLKGAENLGKVTGSGMAKEVLSKKKKKSFGDELASAFTRGAASGAAKVGKKKAKEKAQSIKKKISNFANKEVGFFPGERKIRKKYRNK